jgi:hypothetical protein
MNRSEAQEAYMRGEKVRWQGYDKDVHMYRGLDGKAYFIDSEGCERLCSVIGYINDLFGGSHTYDAGWSIYRPKLTRRQAMELLMAGGEVSHKDGYCAQMGLNGLLRRVNGSEMAALVFEEEEDLYEHAPAGTHKTPFTEERT